MTLRDCAPGLFFIVPARNSIFLNQKICALNRLNVPFLIVCGEKYNHPNVVYHKNAGKWDAINFAFSLLPDWVTIIVLNDVDTTICEFENALLALYSKADLVYCKVQVANGPQVKFYRLLNPLRSKFHIAASGELMLMRKEVLKAVSPIPPCLAEDSYILFKALELGFRAFFCTNTSVTTERTNNLKEEIVYKNRTTLGIYQALNFAKPPPIIRLFYLFLPLFTPLLSLFGKDGKAWVIGISRAFKDYVTKNNPTRF